MTKHSLSPLRLCGALCLALLASAGCGKQSTNTAVDMTSASADMTGAAADMTGASADLTSPSADMTGTVCALAKPPADGAKALVGTWVSEGADVAPLLAKDPANIIKLSAAFAANSTYTVDATVKGGTIIQFTGAYTTTPTAVAGILGIKLVQSKPSAITSEGMFLIDTNPTPNRMYYEVIQTQPPIMGVTPPKAEACFGSTGGVAAGSNIQKYTRQ